MYPTAITRGPCVSEKACRAWSHLGRTKCSRDRLVAHRGAGVAHSGSEARFEGVHQDHGSRSFVRMWTLPSLLSSSASRLHARGRKFRELCLSCQILLLFVSVPGAAHSRNRALPVTEIGVAGGHVCSDVRRRAVRSIMCACAVALSEICSTFVRPTQPHEQARNVY